MNYILILRGVQALFAILVLCLSAAGISKLGDFRGIFNDSGFPALDFLLFCSLFSILSLVYLVFAPVTLPQIHKTIVCLVIEPLNALFWFAGFIAVAAGEDGMGCNFPGVTDSFGNTYTFIYPQGFVTGCQCSKAAAAFGAFSWLLWSVTTGLLVRHFMTERKNTVPARGPGVGGEPPVQMQEGAYASKE